MFIDFYYVEKSFFVFFDKTLSDKTLSMLCIRELSTWFLYVYIYHVFYA